MQGCFRIRSLIVVACAVAPARACSIPVFAYALEYWEQDGYSVSVFHRGPLTGEPQGAVDRLRRASLEGEGFGNYAVRVVDLDGQVDDSMRAIWEGCSASEPKPRLPWVVVLHPPRGPYAPQPPRDRRLWSGPLGEKSVSLLVDSPARREIARGIRSGHAAVWVLLMVGDPAKDKAAKEVLRTHLQEATKLLEPSPSAEDPISQAADEDERIDDGPARVTFSVVRVSRSDPAEQVLVNGLLDSEPDLRAYSEPMAFPVFGRGRVLYALVGKGIHKDNILEACAFLAGPCACVLKVGNPGVDLLMTTDWAAAVPDEAKEVIATSPAVGASAIAQTVLAASSQDLEKASRALVRNSLLGVLGGVVVVAVAAWVLMRKRGHSAFSEEWVRRRDVGGPPKK